MRLWIFGITLLFSVYANSQKLELGKVSVAELQEKAYPADTTAPAAITYKRGRTIFKCRKDGFYIDHEYEFRVKIYKKEGLKWATFSVPYYVGYSQLNDDYLSFSNAVSYNLENGKIVKTKTGNEGKFKKKITDSWNEATLVLGNVKVGSVIEFKYTLRTQDLTEFPTFSFQYDIPVKSCSYTTEIPQYFQYKPIICGFGNVLNTAKIVNGSLSYESEYHQTVSFNFQSVFRSYYAENTPALKDEPFVDNLENYRSAVKHELEKIQFPNEDPKLYSTTWEAVALSIYKSKDFGPELQQRNYFEPFLDPYITQADTPLKKLSAVFDYVKREMTWDNHKGYLVRKGVKKAYADKTGNAAEINLMLVAMLNHAGIQARPVLVSTIDNGIAAFPNRANFNYVIAAAAIDGKTILLDATSKNAAPNILPLRDLNWDGWQIGVDGSAVKIDLVPKSTSKEIFALQSKLDGTGTLSGKMRITKSDYCGFGFREKYKGANQDDYLQKLEKDFRNIEIAQYQADIPDDGTLPVEERFDFTAACEVIGESIYINPLLFLSQTQNPFTAETRALPIYYGFPQMRKYMISIEIPPGFSVVSAPKPVSMTTPAKVGSFRCIVQVTDKNIQITATEEVTQAIVASGAYDNLKAYYQNLVKAQTDKIVLKKI